MTFLGLKRGQDFENSASHPYQDFPEVPLPPRARMQVRLCCRLGYSRHGKNLNQYRGVATCAYLNTEDSPRRKKKHSKHNKIRDYD